MATLSREDKERILKTLEEDREFRYALMGLLGFKEILERQQRLEERFARLEERFIELEKKFIELENRFARIEEKYQELEERFAKLEERFTELEKRFARIEEKYQELEEKFARLEERQQRLEERFAKLEERFARLEERQQKIEERIIRLEEELKDTRRIMVVIAHRFGVLSEHAFREAMRYVVEEVLGVARVESWIYHDSEGIVYGHPAIVEVDVAIRDKEHILVEVKSRCSKADVAELYKIGKLYEKVKGVKPRLVIVAGIVDRKAKELAEEMGVEIKTVERSDILLGL